MGEDVGRRGRRIEEQVEVLRRIARIGDGWIALRSLAEGTPEQRAKLYEYADAVGRDPDDIGVHGLIPWLDTFDQDVLIDRVEGWEELGADYLAISWLRQGYGPDEHRRSIERLADLPADAGISLPD